MLLKQSLSLYRVLKITWKIDLMLIGLCSAAYFVDRFLLTTVNIPTTFPALIGTAIAFFIAFNNNQAYSRWWEARTIWGGLVNDSRSWARELIAHVDDKEMVRKMIFRHIGFLYALKASLRRIPDDKYKKYISDSELEDLDNQYHLPNAILNLQSIDIQKLVNQNKIDGFRFLALNEMIRLHCEHMGKSERINNTVFPTTYIFFTRLFIWILLVITTMSLAEQIGPWSIIFAWIIGFIYHTTHLNGMSLMDPFELKPPCVPLNNITRNIEINLLESLGETNIPEPELAMHNGEYIL
jgi:putative membrane protein